MASPDIAWAWDPAVPAPLLFYIHPNLVVIGTQIGGGHASVLSLRDHGAVVTNLIEALQLMFAEQLPCRR